ncbi:MAG: hypothetical protein Q8P41_26775 [Pseudomonadota bacterium]|nr:hypothetical protein [Pseudomonadota bacterium]
MIALAWGEAHPDADVLDTPIEEFDYFPAINSSNFATERSSGSIQKVL